MPSVSFTAQLQRHVDCPPAQVPHRLWCQHHNGVFRSDDRGLRWDELPHVEPSVFGFAVSGDRLAFGSSTGSLWRTEDGGDRWTSLSTHLPPIYSVRFSKEAR